MTIYEIIASLPQPTGDPARVHQITDETLAAVVAGLGEVKRQLAERNAVIEKLRTCWFVERGSGEWWAGHVTGWTRDPARAVRFCRRDDADAVIIGRDLGSWVWRDCNPFASEHVFVEAALAAESEGK